MKNIFSTTNPTGGLQYHLRSLLNRKRWQPFCEMVETWLNDWYRDAALDNVSTLILIGPNAGYTLPKSFLQKFQRIILNDIDPLAYLLFRARFADLGVPVVFENQDYLVGTSGRVRLHELCERYPGAALLFCNVLGQLPLLLKKNKKLNVETYMQELGAEIVRLSSQHKVASYHDRFSRNLLNPDEVIDHLTQNMFDLSASSKQERHNQDGQNQNKQDGPNQLGHDKMWVRKEFPWRMTIMTEHQIEFVSFL